MSENGDESGRVVTSDAEIGEILAGIQRIAVLGIKPETHRAQPAHYVPRYLQSAGYRIVPVPVYYPDVEEILGEKVFRSLAAVPGDVDMVNVFRRPRDIPPHLDDILAKRPGVVWFQLGIRNDDAAEHLARAGIRVIQNRCTMIDHQRFTR